MTAVRKITVEVSQAMAEEIDAQVASGAYVDATAFVQESVANYLHQRDPEVERWLREEVAPTYDRWIRDRQPGLTSAQVFDGLEARYLARKRGAPTAVVIPGARSEPRDPAARASATLPQTAGDRDSEPSNAVTVFRRRRGAAGFRPAPE